MRRSGEWDQARAAVRRLRARFTQAKNTALLQEGHYFRAKILDTFNTSGASAGTKWEPLKALTIANKKGKSKPLIARGDLKNSVVVLPKTDKVFIGVPSKKTSRDGTRMVDIAAVHEFGKVIVIPVTKRMIGFFFAMLRDLGVSSEEVPASGVGGSSFRPGGVLIVRIPARSYLRSTFKHEYGNVPAARKRFAARVAKKMGPGWEHLAGAA